jgi:hypothetical protein
MTLEIIGAGFGRTGTLSLKTALEKLGFKKCHHMMEVATSADQINYWSCIAEQQDVPTWDQVFDGYKATTDFPACNFYAELANHYPEAKVILTIRDEDSWFRSVNETIYTGWQLVPNWLPRLVPRIGKLHNAISKLIWNGTFAGRAGEPEYAKAVFRAHNEAVQTTIAPNRLLVFQVSDGWQPLCEFLDVPIPEEPFPHTNDTAEMKRRIVAIKCLRALPYALAFGILLFLLI